jgi:hypothetical protein
MNHIYSILVSLFDTILKETHPRTIPARFDLIWFGDFRGDDFKVITKCTFVLCESEIKEDPTVLFSEITNLIESNYMNGM